MIRGAYRPPRCGPGRSLCFLALLRRPGLVPARRGPARGLSARIRMRPQFNGDRGFLLIPAPKTFRSPNGEVVQAPNYERDTRPINATKIEPWPGAPFEPNGDPHARRRRSRLLYRSPRQAGQDADGHDLIAPLRVATHFARLARRRQPVGLRRHRRRPHRRGHGQGRLGRPRRERAALLRGRNCATAGTVLLPVNFCDVVLASADVKVNALLAAQFVNVPTARQPDASPCWRKRRSPAYYGGGTLYATPNARSRCYESVNLEKLLPADIPPGERSSGSAGRSQSACGARAYRADSSRSISLLLAIWSFVSALRRRARSPASVVGAIDPGVGRRGARDSRRFSPGSARARRSMSSPRRRIVMKVGIALADLPQRAVRADRVGGLARLSPTAPATSPCARRRPAHRLSHAVAASRGRSASRSPSRRCAAWRTRARSPAMLAARIRGAAAARPARVAASRATRRRRLRRRRGRMKEAMMSERHERDRPPIRRFPRGILIGAAALIAFAIVAAAVRPHLRRRRACTCPPRRAVRRCSSGSRTADGAVAVHDAADGDVDLCRRARRRRLHSRDDARTCARARERDEHRRRPPFRLTRWSDGTVSLDDRRPAARSISTPSARPTPARSHNCSRPGGHEMSLSLASPRSGSNSPARWRSSTRRQVLHAHVEIDGDFVIEPGDEVLVEDAPTEAPSATNRGAPHAPSSRARARSSAPGRASPAISN